MVHYCVYSPHFMLLITLITNVLMGIIYLHNVVLAVTFYTVIVVCSKTHCELLLFFQFGSVSVE